MNKLAQLSSLNEELRQLTDPALKELSNNLVQGEGNLDSKVVFIGEAPGRDEDRARRPFVGAASKVLNESLETASLHRNDAYITNVVKRRPPMNRPPRKAEIAVFLPYLWRELEIVCPTVICLLGSTAAKALLGRPSTEIRGRLIKEGRWRFLCTYPPAALLYDPGLKPAFLRDLSRLREIIEDESLS